MKNLKVKSISVLGLVLIGCACQPIKIGIETTSTISVEVTTAPTHPSTPITAPTQISTLANQTDVPLKTHTQTIYGFSFKYPATWEIQQESNFIKLINGSIQLQMGFRKSTEEVSISISPKPAESLVQAGSLNFLTQKITRDIQRAGENILAVFYNQGKEVKVGDMLFTFLLLESQPNIGKGIPQDIQVQADQIIASFEATFEFTTLPCIDKVLFVQDVTVLDDSRFSPGEKFIKTWRLLNSGTCPWTTDYSLVFTDGDQMSGQSPQPLISEIAPGQTVDLSVELIAPASTGTYRGNWMLRNDKGEIFGLGSAANKPFWVQITVGEIVPDIRQNLGEPSFRDTLASSNNWYLLDTSNTRFTAGDNVLILSALNTGKNDEWGIATTSPIKNFYLELQFTTTNPCSGLDRYGVIVRAPDPNQGYVYGFSCDGRYRLYIWDGKRYKAIQEWKKSPYIKEGPDQTNRLGISIQGNTIKLFANGQFLSEYTDNTFTEGRFGVFVGAEVTKNFTVYLDEVAYWKFED